MKREQNLTSLLFLSYGILITSCVEEFEAETESLENLLVVEGLLTDETKYHTVALTRLFPFEEEDPRVETGASIKIVNSEGEEFLFDETEPGKYTSKIQFSAQVGRSYTLDIETSDRKDYKSEAVVLPPQNPIADLRAERMTNDMGEEGVGIMLNNKSNSSNPGFFRYEFEETYKIIAPKWEPFRFEVVLNTPCIGDAFVVDILAWEDERRTCFGTSRSQELIQATSLGLQDGVNENLQLHFLSRDDYSISHRYSINVTQYTQTREAYSFYERLSDFSSFSNIFSQVQPGFLEGNITLVSNPDEMVLGYFEVASVSKKRMFFNYEDLFPGEALPPYAISCETLGNPSLIPFGYTCFGPGDCEGRCQSTLIESILAETVVFAGIKEGDSLSPYYTWPSPCGDCTQLGSNVVPEFWME